MNSSKGQGEWFEREIALVQRTYEAEMRVLEVSQKYADIPHKLSNSSV